MDRRKFLTASAAAGASLPLAAIASSTPADDDSQLSAEMLTAVHRQPGGDEHHRRVIATLLTAREWANRIGIQFDWQPTDYDESGNAGEFGRVLARLDGKLIGISEGWYRETFLPGGEIELAWARAELALELMDEFSSGDSNRFITDADGITPKRLERHDEYLRLKRSESPDDASDNDDALSTDELVEAVRRWADAEGFEFRWELVMPHPNGCERLWRCDIYLDDKPFSERRCGWHTPTAADKLEAENEIAVEILLECVSGGSMSTGQ
jgi:hypothetical protein